MELKRIQLTSNATLNWILQGKDNSFNLPIYTKNMLFDQLTESKKYFKSSELLNENIKIKKIQLLEFHEKEYEEHKAIMHMRKLLLDKSKLFSHFLIHGSYSDLKLVKGWSDFDSIAVIKKSTFHNKLIQSELLGVSKELDSIMRKIDRYQHHGIHYIFEEELRSYPGLYLPVEILSHSKCLLSSSILKIKTVDSREYEMNRLESIYDLLLNSAKLGILKHHQKNGKYLKESFKDKKTMYQLKYYLCVLMLLPTLWLNSINIYCKKEDSFTIIKDYFTEDELEIIRRASLIRTLWDQKKGNDEVMDVIPNWVQAILGDNYLIRGGKLAEKLKGKNIK
jgi:hypothetical protein